MVGLSRLHDPLKAGQPGRREAIVRLDSPTYRSESRAIVRHDPLRAGLVARAEERLWSSLRWLQVPAWAPERLEPGTVPRGALWAEGVNVAAADVQLATVRESVRRDRPFGSAAWTQETAQARDLESSLRPRGRPRQVTEGASPDPGRSMPGKRFP